MTMPPHEGLRVEIVTTGPRIEKAGLAIPLTERLKGRIRFPQGYTTPAEVSPRVGSVGLVS
jgi:hypothetical protein